MRRSSYQSLPYILRSETLIPLLYGRELVVLVEGTGLMTEVDRALGRRSSVVGPPI